MISSARSLHWVFKIGERRQNAVFFADTLGMTWLRHEEFEKGCEATCNGPYNGKWSKTMVGYGDEKTHYVCELTYNYGIGSYKQGNDFRGFHISSKEIFSRAKAAAVKATDTTLELVSPDGYPFFVHNTASPGKNLVSKVSLSCSDLTRTKEFWAKFLCMKVSEDTPEKCLFSYGEGQCGVEFVQIKDAVDHAKAGGRVAFACPRANLAPIEAAAVAAGGKILTPLLALETPGKATVEVVILADPDGYEICFVGEEAFYELSATDPKSKALLEEAVENDKSEEWFKKRGGKPTG